MISVRSYKLFHRSYITDIIQKQRENCLVYPANLFEKNLEEILIKAGFFDKFSNNIWWRQEFNELSLQNTYSPENVDKE